MTRITPDMLLKTIVATLASLFVFVCMNGGVSVHGWLGVIQVGLVCGIVAGALAPSEPAAFVAGLVTGFLGGFAFLAWFIGGDMRLAGMLAVVTGVAALAAKMLFTRTRVTATALALVGLALVIAGMWSLTFQAIYAPAPVPGAPSAIELLETRPVAGQQWGDGELWRAVVFRMRDGVPYYEAYRSAMKAGYGLDSPTSVIDVRMPTIFEVWTLVPGWPLSLVWGLLAVASVACLACIGIAREVSEPTLGLGAAAAIAAYTMVSAESPHNVMNVELMGGLIAVVVVYAYLRAGAAPRHRAWMLGAATLALFTFTFRELMIFLPVAGLAGALFSQPPHRRFDLWVWSAALGAGLVVWGAHVRIASTMTSSLSSDAPIWLHGGGVDFLLRGISHNSLLYAAAWVPFALVALGLLGAFSVSALPARVFCLVACTAPLVAFLFVGNGTYSRDLVLHYPTNYWAGIVLPLIFALVPAAFAFLPGVRPAEQTASPMVGRLQEAPEW